MRRPSKALASRIAITGASVTAVLALTGVMARSGAGAVDPDPASDTGAVPAVSAPAAGVAVRDLPGAPAAVVAATPAATPIRRQSVAVTRSGGSR